jgi:hypothetical protein
LRVVSSGECYGYGRAWAVLKRKAEVNTKRSRKWVRVRG